MVFERIKDIISEQFDIAAEKISMESTLEELDIDSIDAMDLIMDMEEEFDLEVPDEVLEAMKTVGDVISYLKEKGFGKE